MYWTYCIILLLVTGHWTAFAQVGTFNFSSSYYEDSDAFHPFAWAVDLLSLNVTTTTVVESNLKIPVRYEIALRLHGGVKNYTSPPVTVEVKGNISCKIESGNGGHQLHTTCKYDPLNRSLKFITLLPQLNITLNMSQFTVTYYGQSGSKNKTEHVDLTLQYCDEIFGSDTLTVTNSGDAVYKKKIEYTCNNTTLVINDTYDRSVTNHSRECQADANWSKKEDNVTCWFPPKANISLEQNNSLVMDGDVIEGLEVSINCIISEEGSPAKSTYFYFRSTASNNNDSLFTPNASDYNATVYCQAQNDYVKNVSLETGRSENITLNVTFKPHAQPYDEERFASVGQNYKMVIKFTANPRLSKNDTSLLFREISKDNSSAELTGDGVSHTYEYNFAIVGEEDFGNYVLIAISPSGKLQNREQRFTVTLSNMQSTTPTSRPGLTNQSGSTTSDASPLLPLGGLIAIGVCGGLLVILIFVLIVWKLRKQSPKQDDSAREERDNPLYGTTSGPSNNFESASEEKKEKKKKKDKEEKANPLYQSSGVAAENIEPAYGTVDQGYTTNNPGNDNSGYNPDTEVQYAAVNKPKKKKGGVDPPTSEEVVYSAINKKKKKDASAGVGLHGASD